MLAAGLGPPRCAIAAAARLVITIAPAAAEVLIHANTTSQAGIPFKAAAPTTNRSGGHFAAASCLSPIKS